MKPVEKPRTAVITVRPMPGGRVIKWEVFCGDCGAVATKKAKGPADKEATAHSRAVHAGTAITKTRQI